MKHFTKYALSLALLLAAGAASLAQQPALLPDNGAINARRYMNGYFGFSYRFPEGWNGNAVQRSLMPVSTKAARYFSLFTANPLASAGSDVRYIGIQADDLAHNSDIRSGKDFLQLSLEPLTGKTGAFEALHSAQKLTYGGRQFYRQDLKSKAGSGSPVFYQAQISTVVRDYALTFSFIAANLDDLQELTRTMESVSFYEPGKMPAMPAATALVNNTLAATQSAAPEIPVANDSATKTSASVAEPPAQPVSVATVVIANSAPAATPAVDSIVNRAMKQTAQIIAPVESAPKRTATGSKPVTHAAAVVSAHVEPLAENFALETTPAALPELHPAAVVIAKVEPVAENFAPAPASAPMPLSASVPAQIQSASSKPVYMRSSAVQSFVDSSSAASALPNYNNNMPAQAATPAYKPEPMSFAPAITAMLMPTREVASASLPAIPAVSAPSVPARIRVSSVSFSSYITRKTMPAYPSIAKTGRVEGEVILDVVVDRNGRLQSVTVISGPALLRKGAEDAVKQWAFKPYKVDGQPIEIESQISMNFRLGQQ